MICWEFVPKTPHDVMWRYLWVPLPIAISRSFLFSRLLLFCLIPYSGFIFRYSLRRFLFFSNGQWPQIWPRFIQFWQRLLFIRETNSSCSVRILSIVFIVGFTSLCTGPKEEIIVVIEAKFFGFSAANFTIVETDIKFFGSSSTCFASRSLHWCNSSYVCKVVESICSTLKFFRSFKALLYFFLWYILEKSWMDDEQIVFVATFCS